MDGAGALNRSAEDGTSLATATRSLTCGMDGDDSSHHAAAVVNEATTTAATVMTRVRGAQGPFDADAFVSAAGAAPGSACSIGNTRSATTGQVATAATNSWSELRLPLWNERAAPEGSSDTGSDAGAGTSFAVS